MSRRFATQQSPGDSALEGSHLDFPVWIVAVHEARLHFNDSRTDYLRSLRMAEDHALPVKADRRISTV